MHDNFEVLYEVLQGGFSAKLIWLDNKYYSCTSQPTIYFGWQWNNTWAGVMLTNTKRREGDDEEAELLC